MNKNLERRLKRLEEHHGACSHRNERGFFPPLFNPTEQQLERVGKELAEYRSCRNAVARRDCSSTTVQTWNDSET